MAAAQLCVGTQKTLVRLLVFLVSSTSDFRIYERLQYPVNEITAVGTVPLLTTVVGILACTVKVSSTLS